MPSTMLLLIRALGNVLRKVGAFRHTNRVQVEQMITGKFVSKTSFKSKAVKSNFLAFSEGISRIVSVFVQTVSLVFVSGKGLSQIEIEFSVCEFKLCKGINCCSVKVVVVPVGIAFAYSALRIVKVGLLLTADYRKVLMSL